MRHYALLLSVLPLALAGCSGSPPYVLNLGEFDRTSPTFAQTPEDISSVTVCYAKRGTAPQEIQKLAVDECAKYNKKAVFLKQDYKHCPLATPVSAHFNCFDPRPAAPKAGKEETPAGEGVNRAGWPFYYSPAPR